jgi:hypothetical protein
VKTTLSFLLAFLFPCANAQQQNQQQQDKMAEKESGHDFLFEASPDQCSNVIYTEIATGISKDAGGATPKRVRLAPKLYKFTCKCGSVDIVARNSMVGQTPSYKFSCHLPVAQGPQSQQCDIDTNRAINDHERIGDQDVFHIRCPVPGTVTSARFVSCNFAGGEACSHINPRNERSGACGNEPRVACIYYQTNDGKFKVIHGVVSFSPDASPSSQ